MTDYTMSTDQPMSCPRVRALASEWVDGALPPDLRAAVEAHLDGCTACADFVADLAAIASEARALPRLEPSRDLWAGIAARIEAPVVALDPRRVTAAPPRRWWRQVAAAAALVAVTAGVTWRLTMERARRELAQGTTPAASPATPTASSPTSPMVAATTGVDSGPAVAPAATAAPDAMQVAAREARSASSRRQAAPATVSHGAPVPAPVVAVALPAAAQAYDREIAAMRTLVAERRDSLSPTTVRVLERNLEIIDQAIAESRAALAQDPSSGLLAEQLTRAMRRKLELLRTAADLPARIS